MKNTSGLEVAALSPVLRRLSKRFTRDENESSDLVQETILKALIHRDKFKENTNLGAWLFTIMRNTFINQYRRSRRSREMRGAGRELYFSTLQDEHTFSSPEGSYVWKDLWKNIEALREELRGPFKMHTSGYKYHEIADHLRIPIGTVKNRIFQARKELQGLLTL